MSSLLTRQSSSDVVTGVATHIADIDQSTWDRLVGPADIYNSYRWLDGLRRAHGADPVVIATDGSGRLLVR
jgi:predicted N-acyltransferase